MKICNKVFSMLLSFILLGTLWSSTVITVSAEEIEVPSYYEYVETEKESITHWYDRSGYLKEGICGIKDSSRGRVSVSGTTFAHVICDTIKVGIYLDESSDGGSTFAQIGSYYFSENNTATCYGSKTNISATSGRYYVARGVHSATKNSTTESTTTRTNAIKCTQ